MRLLWVARRLANFKVARPSHEAYRRMAACRIDRPCWLPVHFYEQLFRNELRHPLVRAALAARLLFALLRLEPADILAEIRCDFLPDMVGIHCLDWCRSLHVAGLGRVSSPQ